MRHSRLQFHESVRQAYRETASWGFIDVFRHLHPDVVQYTLWDYLSANIVCLRFARRFERI